MSGRGLTFGAASASRKFSGSQASQGPAASRNSPTVSARTTVCTRFPVYAYSASRTPVREGRPVPEAAVDAVSL